jgi:hypothetical protein
MKKIIVFTLLFITTASFGQGFLHRDQQKIVDGDGKNIVLRSLGLGGLLAVSLPTETLKKKQLTRIEYGKRFKKYFV